MHTPQLILNLSVLSALFLVLLLFPAFLVSSIVAIISPKFSEEFRNIVFISVNASSIYSGWSAMDSFAMVVPQSGDIRLLFAVGALFGALMFTIAFTMIVLIDIIAMYFHSRWMVNNYPDAFLTDIILSVVVEIEAHPEKWSQMQFKNEILTYIEDAAAITARKLPNHIKARDKATDIWFFTITEEIATAFRNQKRLLLMPQENSRILLIEQFASALVCLLSGNWQHLPRETVQKPTRSERITQLFSFSRGIVAAFLPAVFFWFFQQTSLALSEPVVEYIVVGLIIWIAVSFLTALDPHFSKKITTVKEVVSLPFSR